MKLQQGQPYRAHYRAMTGQRQAPVSSPPGIYYLHTDHLDTPQVITDADQQVVWRGEQQPFGAMMVTVASIDNPLRFPGQYFDQETGLHYNYFRDYDPATGRYIESDPIGLAGGVNTYAYVFGNPVTNFDRNGLKIMCWPWGCKGDAELPPTDRAKPENPKKPKRPKCAESTTNFAACMACCKTVRGNLASGGGTACAEGCARKQGITMNGEENKMCGG